MNRAILHVDMDAFYAAVEMRDNPSLRHLPVVVGGHPDRRGVIAAASYRAREFGVFSAMPSKTAIRLCPELVFVPARHRHYAAVSDQIRAIFDRYTPLVEPLALDEAFLDVTASQRLWGNADDIGRQIKTDIQNELQLTASVGVAPTKFMAKLASDLDKPDGLRVVDEKAIQATLDPLPVSRIWGVGKSGERQLKKLGIDTVRQLRAKSESYLEQKFGHWGQHIWRLANGIDEREVIADGTTKSISHETTFDEDISDSDTLLAVLLDLTEQVTHRLRRHQRIAATVQIKIRFFDFQTITRASSLPSGTDTTQEIWQTARQLFANMRRQHADAIRLLGVGVSGLDTACNPQVDLFEDEKDKQRDLDSVTDSINQRFGPLSVHRGLRLNR